MWHTNPQNAPIWPKVKSWAYPLIQDIEPGGISWRVELVTQLRIVWTRVNRIRPKWWNKIIFLAITYFPIPVSKTWELSAWPRWVNATLVVSFFNDLLKIAWSSPWGAISIVMALLGIWTHASSNSTALSKLLVWYSAEEDLASAVFHLFWGKDVQIHLGERSFGWGITYEKAAPFVKDIT